MRDAQRFQRQLLECQQQLRAPPQQQSGVTPFEVDRQLRTDDLEAVVHLEDVVVNVKVGGVKDRVQEVVDLRAERLNCPLDV